MTIITVIFGVLLILAGLSSMLTPLVTLLSAGYFLSILLFVDGIFGLISAFQGRKSFLSIIRSVLAIAVGVIALIRPGSTLILDALIVYFMAALFLVRGVLSVLAALQAKKLGLNGWFWGAILGVVEIILGIYSFAHPMVTAIATGILIGLYFVEAGLDLIVLGTAAREIEQAVSEETDLSAE